jgi:hypothetical protein
MGVGISAHDNSLQKIQRNTPDDCEKNYVDEADRLITATNGELT